MINVFQPSLEAEELEAVRKVFQSNWVGKGKLTDQFETGFAQFIGTRRDCIRSVSCCTEGLFQSMALLGIGAGDEVVLPSISFVGAANAVAASGARPVFCDVDMHTLNPTADTIAAKLSRRTKAVMILHYGGVPCSMQEICELTRARGLALIEDSACSVASRYRGQACGTFGTVGVWSFDSMKILVTGDGGMIYCNTAELAHRAEESLYLGLLTESGLSSRKDSRWWEFEISCFGRRAIMNDIASAIGLEQLNKLPQFIVRRRAVHEFYDRELAGLDWLRRPEPLAPDVESSYYFYWVQTAPERRDRLASFLRERGIYTTFRYYPLHCVKRYGARDPLPQAEQAARSTLCLPIHQSLTDKDLDLIVQSIRDFGHTL
jgi:dTDP-4-amino-4,6-dideoxygalactose transaminase